MNRTDHACWSYPNIAAAVAVIDDAVVWTHPPNPLSVWDATLSGQRDEYAVELRACGDSEDSALERLDALLGAGRVDAVLEATARPSAHRWNLVSEEDPDETEVCLRCGAQRNRHGKLPDRASITGGWPLEHDCDAVEAVLVAADRVHEAYAAMLEGRDVGALPDWKQ